MVYTISVRNLSFKMNLSNVEAMINNQQATYAILKYAKDIPDSVFFSAIGLLVPSIDELYHRKLKLLVSKYKKATIPVGIAVEADEIVGSVVVEDGMASYYEDDVLVWAKNVTPAVEIGQMTELDDDDDDDDFGYPYVEQLRLENL